VTIEEYLGMIDECYASIYLLVGICGAPVRAKAPKQARQADTCQHMHGDYDITKSCLSGNHGLPLHFSTIQQLVQSPHGIIEFQF
jgi:hypothetical protein